MSVSSSAAAVSYVPEFLAYTEMAVRPLHALLPSSLYLILRPGCLLNFCCALSEYIARTSRFANMPRRLFVSSRCPSRAMSENGISFLLREVSIFFLAPALGMLRPLGHTVFTA